MSIKIVSVLLLSAGLAACSSDRQGVDNKPGKNEFDILCDNFTALVGSENYSSLSEEDRAAQLDLTLTNKLNRNGNAYAAWTAIRNATPTDRYSLYAEAARSTGYQNWNCPAISSHGHEVGSPHN